MSIFLKELFEDSLSNRAVAPPLKPSVASEKSGTNLVAETFCDFLLGTNTPNSRIIIFQNLYRIFGT